MDTQSNLGPYALLNHLGCGTTGKVKIALMIGQTFSLKSKEKLP